VLLDPSLEEPSVLVEIMFLFQVTEARKPILRADFLSEQSKAAQMRVDVIVSIHTRGGS
jgi:N-acetylmuramoyl-L-alanine amidase